MTADERARPRTRDGPEERPVLPRGRRLYLVLAEAPCPYVDGRWERKLLTPLDQGETPEADYALLSRAGFRRSHRFAYRPACSGCRACVPVRVDVEAFLPGRSLRRVRNQNLDLATRLVEPRASEEHFALFRRYVSARHGDGEMARMGWSDYRSMVEDTPLDTFLLELRDESGRLWGVGLNDLLDDGPSAVYTFFEPEAPRRSLGSLMVLRLIELAARQALPYVYLGYWIAGIRKMDYKTRFQPLERLGAAGWEPMPRPS